MQYRRINVPGGTFFFTLFTYERRQIFGEEQAVILLRNAFRSVLQKHPLMIEAAIDPLHMIWCLPENDRMIVGFRGAQPNLRTDEWANCNCSILLVYGDASVFRLRYRSK